MWVSHREQLVTITTCTFEELLKNISLQKYKNKNKSLDDNLQCKTGDVLINKKNIQSHTA